MGNREKELRKRGLANLKYELKVTRCEIKRWFQVTSFELRVKK